MIEVVTYKPQYAAAYVDLNLEWIRKHFAVEAMDRTQLEDPQGQILDSGGQIFFILEHGIPIGTCAMVPHGEREYELAKMAVDPRHRGKGYGDLLMTTAIAWAKKHQARKVILLSNTVLSPAIELYKKHGFETTHLGEHPDYKRCNIVMEHVLTPN